MFPNTSQTIIIILKTSHEMIFIVNYSFFFFYTSSIRSTRGEFILPHLRLYLIELIFKRLVREHVFRARRAIDERLGPSPTTHFSVRFNELLSTANYRSTPVPRVTSRVLGLKQMLGVTFGQNGRELLSRSYRVYSHFDSFDLDAPRIRGFVKRRLHGVGDGLALWEDLCQVSRTEHRPQCAGCQQSSRVTETLNFSDFIVTSLLSSLPNKYLPYAV